MTEKETNWRQHCWHPTGKYLMTAPPIIEHVCCHCDMPGRQHQRLFAVSGHGKYAPKEYVKDVVRPLYDISCEEMERRRNAEHLTKADH